MKCAGVAGRRLRAQGAATGAPSCQAVSERGQTLPERSAGLSCFKFLSNGDSYGGNRRGDGSKRLYVPKVSIAYVVDGEPPIESRHLDRGQVPFLWLGNYRDTSCSSSLIA